MKLLFIRHAQSIGNQQRRMQGQGDYELSSDGRLQAEKLAQRLLTEFWWPSHIYSSPLKRAAQTTEILVKHLMTAPLPAAVSDLIDSSSELPAIDVETRHPARLQVQYASELMEHQNGIFQGLTWMEAQAQYPDLCAALESSPDWIPIPGAETLVEARTRATQFITQLLTQHQDQDQIWVITHSWILQHIISVLLGSNRSWRMHAQNTALFEFWIDLGRWSKTEENLFNTDLWQIRRFNDCRHLKP